MWKELIDDCDAVLFDLDGTIIDSMWVWRQIDIDYFGAKGKNFPEDYQDKIEGMSVYETACFTKNTYGIDDSIEEMLNTWDEMAYEHYANDIPLKEGAYDFIEFLHSKGKKLGIVTSNSSKLCSLVLKKHKVEEFFGVVITSEENLAGKPAPDVYLKAADLLAIKYEKCLVFEDLCNGIRAGKAAGMFTVAIRDDYSEKNWEEKVKLSDKHINDYKEILDEIFNKRS